MEIKDLEIKKKQDKIEKQRFLLAIYILITVIILTFIFLYSKNRNLKRKKETVVLEQKLLRSQMNPHFMFNSLAAIQGIIQDNNPEMADRYIVDFASLMRLILNNSRKEYIEIEKEIQTLKHYLELQKLRFEKKFDYSIEIDPKINITQMMIPPMLVQPFIENSIEHGILHSATKGEINVRFILKENSILFEVEDNGIGLKEAAKIQKESHQSLAMEITKERLINLNQGKRRKITLNIIDLKSESKQGTRVSFEIPFKN
jgi:LytS/YehU family sensor histidine kinase